MSQDSQDWPVLGHPTDTRQESKELSITLGNADISGSKILVDKNKRQDAV